MDENKNIPIRPEWKWYYAIPVGRGRKDYKKDRKTYEIWSKQFIPLSSQIRENQHKMIDVLSACLITLIVSLWTILPQTVNLPNWMHFVYLNFDKVDWTHNWGNAIFLTVVPASTGTILHKFPNSFPNEKIKLVFTIIVKLIPVIILILVWYLPHTQKQYLKYNKVEKVCAFQKVNKDIDK